VCVCVYANYRILCVCVLFIGAATNQDGRSSSLTAPHGPSQQAVIVQALQRAAEAIAVGSSPMTLSTLQMHGTGTALGDPIEIGAAHPILCAPPSSPSPPPLKLAASKAIVGHSEPASGGVGVLHALAEMARRVNPTTLKPLNLQTLKTLTPQTSSTLAPSRSGTGSFQLPSAVTTTVDHPLGFSSLSDVRMYLWTLLDTCGHFWTLWDTE
jgi:3-oxoacyl-(acyl-carrier-protein) synthase